MSSASVKNRQTLTDIAVQYLGSAEAVFELATLNGLSITDSLTPGQMLVLPSSVKNKRIVRVMEEGGYNPAGDQDGPQISLDFVINRIPLAANYNANEASVMPRQTLTDIAVQYLGSAEAVFELATLNGLSITDVVEPGTILLLPETWAADVRKYFLTADYFPAAGVEGDLEGIDYWGIEYDFIVQ